MTGKDGVQTLNDEKKEQRLEDPFDIFSVPAINDDYAYHDDHFIEPSTNVTQTGPIVFEFETSGGERFDSNYTELETHYQIWDKNGNGGCTRMVMKNDSDELFKDEWYHIVAVFEQDSQVVTERMKLYKDGTLLEMEEDPSLKIDPLPDFVQLDQQREVGQGPWSSKE